MKTWRPEALIQVLFGSVLGKVASISSLFHICREGRSQGRGEHAYLLQYLRTHHLEHRVKGGCSVAHLSHLVYPSLPKIASSQRDACTALPWPT